MTTTVNTGVEVYSHANKGVSVATRWGQVAFDKHGFGHVHLRPGKHDEDMTALANLKWLATQEHHEAHARVMASQKAAEAAVPVDSEKEALKLKEPMFAPAKPSEAEPPAGEPRQFAVENPPVAMVGETHILAPDVPSEAETNLEKKHDSQVKEAAVENAKEEVAAHEAARTEDEAHKLVDQVNEQNESAVATEKKAAKKKDDEAAHDKELLDQKHIGETVAQKKEREDHEFMIQQQEMEKSHVNQPAPKAHDKHVKHGKKH